MRKKVHIFFAVKQGPSGGGNQFLKALRGRFKEEGCYEESVEKADVILFNSHQHFGELLKVRLNNPHKLYVHRVDGPMRLYNVSNDKRDFIVNFLNRHVADKTIFQSKWSKECSLKLGASGKIKNTVILNAPDPSVFFNKNKGGHHHGKIKVVMTSWSKNFKKGFSIYEWLDQNLDPSKFELHFVGRSPIRFENIKCHGAMSSKELVSLYQKMHIYLTASENDPCSNSLIEAMHCGLPAIALKSGGHPEIVGKAGELFLEKEQVEKLICKVFENYQSYAGKTVLPDLNTVSKLYEDFLFSEDSKPKRSVFNFFILNCALSLLTIKKVFDRLIKS